MTVKHANYEHDVLATAGRSVPESSYLRHFNSIANILRRNGRSGIFRMAGFFVVSGQS